jgi:hypothetical protein
MVITLVNDNVRGRLGIYSVVERCESISIRTASRTSGDAHVAALEAVYSTVPITMEGLLTLISAKKSRMRFMSWYSAKDTCATCFFVHALLQRRTHALSLGKRHTHTASRSGRRTHLPIPILGGLDQSIRSDLISDRDKGLYENPIAICYMSLKYGSNFHPYDTAGHR